MEMKSVGDCLNLIGDAIVEKIGKCIGISNLENIHNYLLEIGQSVFIKDRVALSIVLSKINSTIENHYQTIVEEDIKNEYIQLRKLILVWLIECSTEPEVDNQ